MDERVSRASSLAKSGGADEARRILLDVLKDEPSNEQAWIWLIEVLPNVQKKARAAEIWLRQVPSSKRALKAHLHFTRLLAGAPPAQSLSDVPTGRVKALEQTATDAPTQGISEVVSGPNEMVRAAPGWSPPPEPEKETQTSVTCLVILVVLLGISIFSVFLIQMLA